MEEGVHGIRVTVAAVAVGSGVPRYYRQERKISGRGHGTDETKVCEEDFGAQAELGLFPWCSPETLSMKKRAPHQSIHAHLPCLPLFTNCSKLIRLDSIILLG